MKIDRNALKEAGVDTLLGAIVNFPLSWLTLSIVLIFYHQLVYTFFIAADYPFNFGNHPQILHKGLFSRS
jgi:hypothetical protein